MAHRTAEPKIIKGGILVDAQVSVARHGQGFVLKIGEQGRTAISLSAIGMTGRTVADLGVLKISQTMLSRRAQTAAMLQIEIVRIVPPPRPRRAGATYCASPVLLLSR